jgi:hypothetical protein
MSASNSPKASQSGNALSTDDSDKAGSDSTGPSCTYWVRDDGREFITDPNGDVVNLARLTAYAEHGDDIHEVQAHHEIPLLKIDAPAFLDALTQEEHGAYHGQDPDPVEVDGFPLLRPEQ